MGADEAGTVWTRMSVDAKRASQYAFSGSAATITGMLAQLDGKGDTTGSQPVRGVRLQRLCGGAAQAACDDV